MGIVFNSIIEEVPYTTPAKYSGFKIKVEMNINGQKQCFDKIKVWCSDNMWHCDVSKVKVEAKVKENTIKSVIRKNVLEHYNNKS